MAKRGEGGADPLDGYPVGFEDLADLLEGLREAGYNVGLGQHLAARRLLLVLASEGRLPEDPAALRSLLGPLLASTPGEQEEFHRRFDLWLATRRGAPSSGLPTRPARPSFLARHALLLQTVGLVLLVALALAALVGALHSVGWGRPTALDPAPDPVPTRTAASPDPGGPGPPSPLPSLAPVPAPAPPRVREAGGDHLGAVLVASLLLGVVGLAIHRLWWQERARDFLERRATQEAPDLDRLRVTAAGEALFDPIALNRSSQVLRTHERVPSDRLDVPRTVENSVRTGGLFTPVFQLRPRLPEYLALVERSAHGDHQAHLALALVESLRRRGLHVDVLFFERDPRHCRTEGEKGTWLTLPELLARFPGHRLWLFTDGEPLLDPLTAAVPAWAERLEAWPVRSVFTPVPPSNWGWREATLREAGFWLLPMDEAGLERSLDREPPTGADFGEGLASMLPADLVKAPERWTSAASPPLEEVLRLFGDLRAYLGPDGLEWLAATALFPELRWELTLLLGHQLQPDGRLLRAERVAALARLPWFRSARQPDWLRAWLLTELAPERREVVQAALEKVLLSTLEGPVEGLELQVSAREHGRLRELWREVVRRLQARGAEGPFQDSLFLSATAASPAFQVPVRVARWLRRRMAELNRESRLELPPPRTAQALCASGLLAGAACGWLACLVHPLVGLAAGCAWLVTSKVSHDINPGSWRFLRVVLERSAMALGVLVTVWPVALPPEELPRWMRAFQETPTPLTMLQALSEALDERLGSLVSLMDLADPVRVLTAAILWGALPFVLWWLSWRFLLFLRRGGHLNLIEVMLPGERLERRASP